MAMTSELVAQYHCLCGEGPLYDSTRDCVFWTDIDSGRLFRFDCATGQHRQIYQGEMVGGFTLQADGQLVLFRVRDIVKFDPETGVLRKVRDFVDAGSSRFNDTSAGPGGECFAGTIGSTNESGGLFLLMPKGEFKELFRGTGCANGMGWSPDRRTMYWTCSTRNVIFAYDFDAATGKMNGEREFHCVTDRATFGTCDGLTVDAEGTVYSARWDGRAIYLLAPDGTAKGKIDMPVPKVTSMCFGGKGLTDLYITTASRNDGAAGAGGLYRLAMGVRGQEEFRSRVGA